MKKLYLLTLLVSVALLAGCASKSDAGTKVGPELTKFLSKSSKPAVLKFYAEWCSSCKQFKPAYDAVAAKSAASVDFFEIDIDDKSSKALVKELKIARIPETLMVTKDRSTIIRNLGPIPEAKFQDQVKTLALQ